MCVAKLLIPEMYSKFEVSRKGGNQMVATGQLLSTLNLRVILSMVAGETTVDEYLLMENAEFLTAVRKANKIEELYDFVNENY